MSWRCERCNTDNNDGVSVCDVCDAARTYPKIEDVSLETKAPPSTHHYVETPIPHEEKVIPVKSSGFLSRALDYLEDNFGFDLEKIIIGIGICLVFIYLLNDKKVKQQAIEVVKVSAPAVEVCQPNMTYRVKSIQLNLRSSPGKKQDNVSTQLNQNEVVCAQSDLVQYQGADDRLTYWGKVKYKDMIGWVNMCFVKPIEGYVDSNDYNCDDFSISK